MTSLIFAHRIRNAYTVKILNFIRRVTQRCQACNFIKKKTLAQVFPCEFFEISKDTFSSRTPRGAASVLWRSSFMFT